MSSDEMELTLATIRAAHRQRVFAMNERKGTDLALGAYLRTQLGWRKDLDAAERKRINALATALVDIVAAEFRTGKVEKPDLLGYADHRPVILAQLQSRHPWAQIEKHAEKQMEKEAKSLPAWDGFGKDIKGFGARSLAVILAEAGDLGGYASVAKLWKRMGLAVMDGVRQGGLRKLASADEWTRHGYSRVRRSHMFVIGDTMIKAKSAYRDLYLARKRIEVEKAEARGLAVIPAAKIPEKRKAEFMSEGHVHRRAQRYMEKRLLKHLWQAWRRTNVIASARANVDVSASEIRDAA